MQITVIMELSADIEFVMRNWHLSVSYTSEDIIPERCDATFPHRS